VADGNIGTPLCSACAHGELEIIRLFLRMVPKVDITCGTKSDQSTPLHKAAQNTKRTKEIIELLLSHSVDINIKNQVRIRFPMQISINRILPILVLFPQEHYFWIFLIIAHFFKF
jgi:ankyrin repeat protein